MVPLAHANDGGGSIRIPASECGLVGLKPTRGRTSLAPDHGESWEGMVVELAVTRSVRDTAAVLDAVSGIAPGDPYGAPPPVRPFSQEVGADPGSLRIGVMRQLPAGAMGGVLHSDCIEAVDATTRLLEGMGHRITEAYPAPLDDSALSDSAVTVVAAAQARDLEYWGEQLGRPITADDVDSDNWAVAEMGRQLTATAYLGAVDRLHAWSRRVAMWWADTDLGGEAFDVLVTPTIPEPPPPLGELVPQPRAPLAGFMRSGQLVAYTLAFNVTGQPAVSLPLHWNAAGLPIGVQFVGAFGREDVLLRLASQLEQAQPWRDRRPPVHA
jgi:amidase